MTKTQHDGSHQWYRDVHGFATLVTTAVTWLWVGAVWVTRTWLHPSQPKPGQTSQLMLAGRLSESTPPCLA